jgi:hypothetical protein
MEDREQPFAAFVLETLSRRNAELGWWWAERAQLAPLTSLANREQSADSNATGDVETPVETPAESPDGPSTRYVAEHVVRTILDAATGPIAQIGWVIGTTAHRSSASLHQLHEGLDLLTTALLEAAGEAAGEHGGATGRDGLALAHRIVGAASVLRAAACSGYTQAVEDELRERYRAIRHDLRNPLGTLKSAIALLTDETLPPDMRQSSHVRAVAARNARSLDRLIGEALGDEAARLSAFETPREPTTRSLAESPTNSPADWPADSPVDPSASGERASAREQRDDVARARQRSNLESGAL